MKLRGLEWTEEQFLSLQPKIDAEKVLSVKSVKQNQNVAVTRLTCLTLLRAVKYES